MKDKTLKSFRERPNSCGEIQRKNLLTGGSELTALGTDVCMFNMLLIITKN